MPNQYSSPPEMAIDQSKTYTATIDTSKGTMTAGLFGSEVPVTVNNFVFLAREGFYTNGGFHRVIKDFMVQGGCPKGDGTGGPGYEYDGEFSPRARHDRPHLLSMANAGPGTDGSQFFLTFVPTPHLDDNHTIFGEIVEGTETIGELEKRGSSSGNTTERLLMNSTAISVE